MTVVMLKVEGHTTTTLGNVLAHILALHFDLSFGGVRASRFALDLYVALVVVLAG